MDLFPNPNTLIFSGDLALQVQETILAYLVMVFQNYQPFKPEKVQMYFKLQTYSLLHWYFKP
jgi:hypothetical protein